MSGLIGQPLRNDDTIDLTRAASANPGLMARILRYDPALLVYYDRQVGAYGLARKARGGQIVFVALLLDDKGLPMPFDSRVMETIAKWDLRPPTLSAAATPTEEAARRDLKDLARWEKQERQFDEAIDYQTRSNKRQILAALERLM